LIEGKSQVSAAKCVGVCMPMAFQDNGTFDSGKNFLFIRNLPFFVVPKELAEGTPRTKSFRFHWLGEMPLLIYKTTIAFKKVKCYPHTPFSLVIKIFRKYKKVQKETEATSTQAITGYS
jgi:hypothetical protein